MPCFTHARDVALTLRIARPLRDALKELAKEEQRRSTADLVREILTNWTAARITERNQP
jgi:hypothetical protein